MNPNRTYEENMAALKKVLTQRTYTALSHRNIEFVLKYQNASLQELAAYLRRQQAELRHIPGRTEIIGGDFIELRFRGWVNALEAIGVSRELAAKRSTPALEKTALFQAEFNTQRELDKAAKAEAKKQNKAKEKPPIQGKGRRFRAVFHKVKLHLTAVNMTVEIHNHCLCSTAIHNTDNMQHSDRFIHTFASYPCISSS